VLGVQAVVAEHLQLREEPRDRPAADHPLGE
jgi:hypothetical protein